MDGGIITFPVRVGIGGTRLVLRAAGGTAGFAAKLGVKATMAATGAAGKAIGRVGDQLTGGRAGPDMDRPSSTRDGSETRLPVNGDVRPEPAMTTAPVAPPVPPTAHPTPAAPPAPTPHPPIAAPPPPTASPPPTAPPPPAPPSASPEQEAPPPLEAAEPAHVSEEPELVSEVAEPGAEDGAGASVAIAEPWPGYRKMTANDVISKIADATPAELAAIELFESSNRNRESVRAAVQRSLKLKTGRGSLERQE
jgi:hypothetical protein